MHACIAEKRIVRSRKSQYLDPCDSKYVSLLLLSPDHGSVQYQWEKKGRHEWESIDVSNSTCVLYVKSCGIYKCTVAGEAHLFEVGGKTF